METPYLIGMSVFLLLIVGAIVWLVRDAMRDRRIRRELNKKNDP